MSKTGLAETSQSGTISAPKTMYEDYEQGEDVPRGFVKVTEVIAYDFDKTIKVLDELTGKPTGEMKDIEKGRKPYFCLTKEQEYAFKANNPDARIEKFTIQLLKSAAKLYMNSPRNMKQFKEKTDA